MRPAADVPPVQLFRDRIRELFGAAGRRLRARRRGAPDEGEPRAAPADASGCGFRPASAISGWRSRAGASSAIRRRRSSSGASPGLAIAILGTFFIVWKLNRPLARARARRRASSARAAIRRPWRKPGPSEIRAVTRAFNQMKEDLQQERARPRHLPRRRLARPAHAALAPAPRGRDARGQGRCRGARARDGRGRGRHERDHRPVHRLHAQRGRRAALAREPLGARAQLRRARRARRRRRCAASSRTCRCSCCGRSRCSASWTTSSPTRRATPAARSSCATRATRAGCVLSVLDRGPGIPPEHGRAAEGALHPARRGAQRLLRRGPGPRHRQPRRRPSTAATLDLLAREGGGLEARVTLPGGLNLSAEAVIRMQVVRALPGDDDARRTLQERRTQTTGVRA